MGWMTEILRNWPDVKVEEYNIYTEDGYQILVVRAYRSLDKDPIVLGHSIFITPLGFVNRGRKSLVHYLIKQGHDVWIINFRSSAYSRGHKNLTINDDAYWNFSFHEMGIYDLDSALELVTKKTNKKAIYLGYSVGTTVGYVYNILKADSAKTRLKGMILLGPIALLNHIKSYLKYIIPLSEYFGPVIYQRTHGRVPLKLELFNCSSLLNLYLYKIMELPLYGDDFKQIDDEYLPIEKLQNSADSVGVEVLIHFTQILRSKKFQQRDFGKDMNLGKYGQETPPPYKASDISVPLAIFVGNNDWISTKQDSKSFYGKVDTSLQCGFEVIKHEKWNHNDFIEASDVVELLYKPLYEVVLRMGTESCNS